MEVIPEKLPSWESASDAVCAKRGTNPAGAGGILCRGCRAACAADVPRHVHTKPCPAGRGVTRPASADQPPPEDPGMVKVSVPEARRLLRLATTPMTVAARQLGYAWSRWRRKHQARARYHHYQARLRAGPA